jgi:predicted transcriptional regulator
MSITFACKRIMKDELIQCALEIKKTPYKILMLLLERKKKLKASEIVKEIGLKRCSIQKALKELLKKELVKRSQINLASGGYLYCYYSKDKKEIKNKITNILDSWHKKAKEEISKI